MKKLLIFIFFFFLSSCKPMESLETFVFDNTQFNSFLFTANQIKVKQTYQPIFEEPYIDHSILNSPSFRLKNWINENISSLGNENLLEINILDASIKRNELIDDKAKTLESKELYKYELFFLIEFALYDNSNYLIATTNVQSFRSTTSSKFISINEKDRIIDELIFESLNDISNEAEKYLNLYMSDYLL